MATTTRIKVSRETLLARLRAERERQASAYTKAEFEYDQKMQAFLPKLEDEIESFVELIATDADKALERIDANYDGARVMVRFPRLRLPSRPKLDTRRLDQMISILDAASDEFISIAADDDYARYL